eukprot:16795-Pelagomonas_calceolata.AAC.1
MHESRAAQQASVMVHSWGDQSPQVCATGIHKIDVLVCPNTSIGEDPGRAALFREGHAVLWWEED